MSFGNLIFDLDGTLIDSRSGIEFSAQAALRAVFPDRDWTSLRLPIGIPIRGLFAQLLGNADPVSLDSLERQFRVSYDSKGWKLSRAYRGAENLLADLALAKIACFVATNKPKHAASRILEHLHLDEYFRDVVAPDSGNPPFSSKQDMLSHILRRHRLKENETLFVGDTPEDRSAADAVGIAFAAATYGYGDPLSATNGKRCCTIVSRLSQLADAVGLSHAPIITSCNSIRSC